LIFLVTTSPERLGGFRRSFFTRFCIVSARLAALKLDTTYWKMRRNKLVTLMNRPSNRTYSFFATQHAFQALSAEPVPPGKLWRRGAGSNRRIKVLQTSALPLGYRAANGKAPFQTVPRRPLASQTQYRALKTILPAQPWSLPDNRLAAVRS
jgi:hypothetical protein